MQTVDCSTLCANLREYLAKVRDEAKPVLVTSGDESANAVLINIRDYENLLENMGIVSNGYLYEKLLSGRRDLETEFGKVCGPVEFETDSDGLC
jgi:prevent-host-death family protein